MKYSDSEIPFAPILTPTIKEFANFREYIFKIFADPKFANGGSVKIIPPILPNKNCYNAQSFIDSNVVKSPLLQEIYGSKSNIKRYLLNETGHQKEQAHQGLQNTGAPLVKTHSGQIP